MKRIFSLGAFASLLWIGASASAQVALDDEFAKEPSWKSPTLAEVRAQVTKWLDERKPDEALRKQAEALWADDVPASDLLPQTVKTIALIDGPSKTLADLCSKPHGTVTTPEFAWLADEKTPAFMRNNLRLWLGKWLAQERLYDEALPQLKDLQATDVVDPATLLFYQSVCHHWMLHKTEGLASINKLLEQRKTIPRRYEQVADLMQSDLSDLEDESLDHISRRMNDVTRRLDLGHAGKQVRTVEDGIVASLDKLIKDMQDRANQMQQMQMRQQQQRQRQQGQQDRDRDQNGRERRMARDPEDIRSLNPADVSRAAHAHGPGEVQSKNIGEKSGWGDLPPKEREEAMQQISKEFPSHYRDIIQQYFRKLASEEEEK
jgi:hypothetical protein